MHFAVMDAAERNSELVAHLAAERTRLHEPQVMRIGVFSPTHKTRLLGNESQMFLVAMATRLHNRKSAFVDTRRYLNCGLDARGWPSRKCCG